MNEKLASIKSISSPSLASGVDHDDVVEINFEDGTVDRFDGVIGADGVFGVVQQFVLRDRDQATVGPSPNGFWDARKLVPYQKADHGAYLLHDVLEDRTLVQCIMSGPDDEIPAHHRTVLTRERLMTRELEGWLEGPIARKMIDVSASIVVSLASNE